MCETVPISYWSVKDVLATSGIIYNFSGTELILNRGESQWRGEFLSLSAPFLNLAAMEHSGQRMLQLLAVGGKARSAPGIIAKDFPMASKVVIKDKTVTIDREENRTEEQNDARVMRAFMCQIPLNSTRAAMSRPFKVGKETAFLVESDGLHKVVFPEGLFYVHQTFDSFAASFATEYVKAAIEEAKKVGNFVIFATTKNGSRTTVHASNWMGAALGLPPNPSVAKFVLSSLGEPAAAGVTPEDEPDMKEQPAEPSSVSIPLAGSDSKILASMVKSVESGHTTCQALIHWLKSQNILATMDPAPEVGGSRTQKTTQFLRQRLLGPSKATTLSKVFLIGEQVVAEKGGQPSIIATLYLLDKLKGTLVAAGENMYIRA